MAEKSLTGHTARLNRLIVSLTPGQRRYVRRWLKRWQANTHVVALYDYLIKNPQASHAQIKHHFSKSNWVRQLSVVKHHLYHAILNALVEQLDDTAPFSPSALRTLHHIHVLIEQKLWEDALKSLNEALQKNYQAGNHFVLLGLLHLTLRLHAASDYSLITPQHLSQFKSLQRWLVIDLKEWSTNATAFLIAFSTYKHTGRAGYRSEEARGRYRQVQEHLEKPSPEASFLNFYLYAQTLLLLAGHHDNYDAVISFVDELERFIHDKHVLRIYAVPLSAYVLNALITLMEAGHSSQAEKLLAYLRRMARAQLSRNNARALMVLRNYVAGLLYLTEYASDARKVSEEDMQIIERVANQLPGHDWYKAYIHLTMAKLAFAQKDYAAARQHLAFFEKEGRDTSARDLHAFSFMIAAITCLEQGDIRWMERYWKRASYYLQKAQLMSDATKAVLNFLSRARYREPDQQQWQQLYHIVRQDNILCRYFNFPAWIRQHVHSE